MTVSRLMRRPVPEAYAQQGTCAECFLDPETGCAMCRFQVEFGTENCCTPSCMVCDCNSVPCGPGLSDLGPRVLDATLLADLAVEIKNRHVSPDGAQGLTSFSVQTGAEGWSMRVIRSVLFGHGLLVGGDGAIYACDTTLVAHIVDLGTALDEGPRLPTLAARGLGCAEPRPMHLVRAAVSARKVFPCPRDRNVQDCPVPSPAHVHG